MAFEGVAGVRARSANSYESFVQYRVRPTEGSKASELTGYTLTPVWTTDLEVLSTSYRRGNNPSVEIMTSQNPIEIHFTVEGTGPWTFSELEYHVRDDKGFVASLYVPAFIPANRDSGSSGLIAHKDLSLSLATTIALTAVDACKANGYAVSAHVVGREGQVIVALRNESAGPAAWESSFKKAYTARTFSRTSGEFAEGVKGNPNAGALWLTNIVPAQGALPIKVDGETIGAVGVSGAPGGDKDEACAKAGLARVFDSLK